MYIVTNENRNFDQVLPLVGGKGGNLLKLTEAGADVPAFVVLKKECFLVAFFVTLVAFVVFVIDRRAQSRAATK